jgi:hypothetical protein
MNTFLVVLRCIGIIILGFVVIILINLPHDTIINAIGNGTAKNHIPIGMQAEVISAIIIFLAGFLASIVVGLLAGKRRNGLLIILALLFLAADLQAVLTNLVSTSIGYRIAMVAMVPIEVWAGFLVTKKSKDVKLT